MSPSFVALDPGVEVNGRTILSVVFALKSGQAYRSEILHRHDLVNIEPMGWYPQQKWLDAFREFEEKLGRQTLYMIGKAIPKNADFPTKISHLRQALESIDIAYHMNHRKGEIGHYQLADFNEASRQAVMHCRNPYPSDFDRGIITAMVERFKPFGTQEASVYLDPSKPSRLEGAEACTYQIRW